LYDQSGGGQIGFLIYYSVGESGCDCYFEYLSGTFMTQYQPPFQPDYRSYVPPLSLRPTSVTVIAILAIIIGSISVLGLLCSAPQYMGVRFGPPNPVVDAVHDDPVLFWFMMLSMAFGTVLAIAQLWGGIGALSLKPSARTALIWYAILYMVMGVLGLILNIVVINPRMQQIVNKTVSSNPQMNNPTMKTVMQYSQYGGYCMAIVLLIWPVIILYVMTRPHVKAAFQSGGMVPHSTLPPPFPGPQYPPPTG
jgi:hypothetical protein